MSQEGQLNLQVSAVPVELMARAIARLRARGINPDSQAGFVRAAIAIAAGCTDEEVRKHGENKVPNRRAMTFEEFASTLDGGQ